MSAKTEHAARIRSCMGVAIEISSSAGADVAMGLAMAGQATSESCSADFSSDC